MRQVGNKISYVRNPFARRSFICLGLGAFSLYLSVQGAGQGGPNTGAYGFSSIVAAAAGLWYGILSFTEDAIIFWPRSELPWKDLLSSSGS